MSVARLGGLDAAFLAIENPLTRLHVMAIMVLDPSPCTCSTSCTTASAST